MYCASYPPRSLFLVQPGVVTVETTMGMPGYMAPPMMQGMPMMPPMMPGVPMMPGAPMMMPGAPMMMPGTLKTLEIPT